MVYPSSGESDPWSNTLSLSFNSRILEALLLTHGFAWLLINGYLTTLVTDLFTPYSSTI